MVARATDTPETDKTAYERHKERTAARQREIAAEGKEIGELPAIVDVDRRERCRFNLQLFAETYLRTMFKNIKMRWAGFHTTCFKILQETFLKGGVFAVALPRGSGKSVMIEAAIIWAASYGHCRYAAVVCATDPLAMNMLADIKTQFEVQPLLCEDFPEICIPIRKLEGKAQNCHGQTYAGERTRIEWNKDHIVLPTIPGSQASGFRIATAGITGSGMRGLRFALADGTIIRPDVAILDDPQTDESATSVEQCRRRMAIVRGAVLGMAGPGEKISVVACVTVIARGDVADTLLNTPDWQPVRFGILTRMPDKAAMVWWSQYRDIQIDAKTRRLEGQPWTEFYRQHRTEMDAGFEATWEDRFNPEEEISAIQAAMNLFYLATPEQFMSEYMNDPEELQEAMPRLDANIVAARLTGLDWGTVPAGYEFMTIGVDVQKSVLFFVLMAWKMDLTGSIVDYGTVPRQMRRDFYSLDNLDKTLQSESGAADSDEYAAVAWGLMQLGYYLFGLDGAPRRYFREDGLELFIEKGLIDIGAPNSAMAVANFCRTSRWRSIFTPSRGMVVLDNRPHISEWAKRENQQWPADHERRECGWMGTAPKGHGCREVYFDKSQWFTHVATGLSLPLHSPGSISLCGRDPNEHRMLSSHLTSHKQVIVPVKGVQIIRWDQITGCRDDLLDATTLCCVAASRRGARLKRQHTAMPVIETPKRAWPSDWNTADRRVGR